MAAQPLRHPPIPHPASKGSGTRDARRVVRASFLVAKRRTLRAFCPERISLPGYQQQAMASCHPTKPSDWSNSFDQDGLFTESQPLNGGTIAFNVLFAQVGEQTATPAD